jgi:hypothetical protein
LITGLETLIALLRNTKSANAEDVELYLREYPKFIYKLESIDAGSLDLEIVKEHLSNFIKILPSFTLDKDSNNKFNEFAVLFKWGSQYCKYAIQVLKANHEQNTIEDLKQQKEDIVQDIAVMNSVDQILQEEDLQSFVDTLR